MESGSVPSEHWFFTFLFVLGIKMVNFNLFTPFTGVISLIMGGIQYA